jgi:hypothetical protein
MAREQLRNNFGAIFELIAKACWKKIPLTIAEKF